MFVWLKKKSPPSSVGITDSPGEHPLRKALKFHLSPTKVTASDTTLSTHEQNVTRLYEQGVPQRRSRAQRLRWFAWALGANLAVHAVPASAVPTSTVDLRSITLWPCFTPTLDAQRVSSCGRDIEYQTEGLEMTYRWYDLSYICQTLGVASRDDGLSQTAYDSIRQTAGLTPLSQLGFGDSHDSVVRNQSRNGLSTTPTACLRQDTSVIGGRTPVANQYHMAVFPPVLNPIDFSVVTPQLVPDAPIEVICTGDDTYAGCYERAKIAYNAATCNGGAAGSCGTLTLTAAQSLADPFAQAEFTVSAGITGGTATLTTSGGSGGGAVTFALTGGTGTCQLLDHQVIAQQPGSCLITATKAGGTEYRDATATLELIWDVNQSITFTGSPTSKTVGDGSFTVTATGGGSGNPVILSSTDINVCRVNGHSVWVIKAGTCTLHANQAGNAYFNAAPQAAWDILVSELPVTPTPEEDITEPEPEPEGEATTFPEGDSVASDLTENTPEALQLVATGENLQFSITDGADAALFSVDANGLLTFVEPPDFERPTDSDGDNVYEVTVLVTGDNGTATQTLRITVADETGLADETPPELRFEALPLDANGNLADGSAWSDLPLATHIALIEACLLDPQVNATGACTQSEFLYSALLGRVFDIPGLAFWINRSQSGTTGGRTQSRAAEEALSDNVRDFLASAEFQAIATAEGLRNTDGRFDHAALLSYLYREIGREADAVGYHFWLAVGEGEETVQLLAAFTAAAVTDAEDGVYIRNRLILTLQYLQALAAEGYSPDAAQLQALKQTLLQQRDAILNGTLTVQDLLDDDL